MQIEATFEKAKQQAAARWAGTARRVGACPVIMQRACLPGMPSAHICAATAGCWLPCCLHVLILLPLQRSFPLCSGAEEEEEERPYQPLKAHAT